MLLVFSWHKRQFSWYKIQFSWHKRQFSWHKRQVSWYKRQVSWRKRQKEGKKIIELNAYRRENMFFIIIKNSFDGNLAQNRIDGRLLTTKTDSQNHGLGLRNIEVCAEKYYGKVETSIRNKEFELAVMLQKRVEL